MICTKCSIDKPVSEFHTYYHSTQKKTRTRKVCKECYKEQQRNIKKRYREIKMKQEPNTFQCRRCLEFKDKKEFFVDNRKPNGIYLKCKECCKMDYLIENGGNKNIPVKPNEYYDNIQKTQTFYVLQKLGYLFNEELGIWFKKGVKELRDGELYFPKLVNKPITKGFYKLTQKKIQMVKKMREDGNKVDYIAKVSNLSYTTVWKIINDKI